MKKLLTIFLVFTFLSSFSLPLLAQIDNEESNPNLDAPQFQEEIEDINDDEREEDEDIDEEERTPLSEQLRQEEESPEIIQIPRPSFFTILGAILIPSIFIIICYLIIKFFNF